MASRFAEVDENGMQDLIVSSENENFIKSTDYWPNGFQKFGQKQGKWNSALKSTSTRLPTKLCAKKNFALDGINM